MTENCYWTK